jgi:hypothetical protein
MQIVPCSLGPHSYGSDNCFNVVLDDVDNRAMKIGMVANEGRGEIDASFEVFRVSWRTWNGSAPLEITMVVLPFNQSYIVA